MSGKTSAFFSLIVSHGHKTVDNPKGRKRGEKRKKFPLVLGPLIGQTPSLIHINRNIPSNITR